MNFHGTKNATDGFPRSLGVETKNLLFSTEIEILGLRAPKKSHMVVQEK